MEERKQRFCYTPRPKKRHAPSSLFPFPSSPPPMARGGRGRSGGGPPSSADPLAAIRDAVPGVGDDDIRAALDDAGGRRQRGDRRAD